MCMSIGLCNIVAAVHNFRSYLFDTRFLERHRVNLLVNSRCCHLVYNGGSKYNTNSYVEEVLLKN